MANPKKKHTPMRRDMRRSQNFRLELGSLSRCGNCSAAVMPHRVCPVCGFYGGKLTVPPRVKKSKTDEK
jgi:large subunit ribosomal protein L32